MNDRQYGFRHQRSTGDLLAYVTHVWNKLIHSFADFLSGRKITVVVDGFFSCFHNINAGVPQGSVLALTLFLLHINDLLSSTTNPIHSFADDSTMHAGIMSNRPISVVKLERRRLAMAASLSKNLEAITAWGLKNMVEFNASKTQYCTLSKYRCPNEHSVLMNNQALPISHSFNLSGVSITESMIWHEHISSIAKLLGKGSDICSEPGSTSHHPTFSRYTIFWELPPLLPCLYLTQSRERQFDSSVTRP
nr:unnamed protein product [Callosobruchus chinensis]